MSDITREQFAEAVAAAISSVHHLYREVYRLMSGLRDDLADAEPSFRVMRGSLLKGGRDHTRLVIRNEYGALFAPMGTEVEEADDEDEDAMDDAEGGDDETDDADEKRKGPAEIAADQALLVVRIAMFEPRKTAAFEPEVQYAVLDQWSLGNRPRRQDDKFVLPTYMLRRIPKALAHAGGLAEGERLATHAAPRKLKGAGKHERHLTCRLARGVTSVPLYTLETAESLEELTSRMRAMWTSLEAAE